MKCWKTLTLFFVCVNLSFGQNLVSNDILKSKSEGLQFVKVDKLFSLDKTILRSGTLDKYVKQSTKLNLKSSQLKSLVAEKKDAMNLILPFEDQTVELELVRKELYTDDFFVTTSESRGAVPYNPGIFYHGIVKNKPNSLVTISFFENEVIGIINGSQFGNLTLGKYDKNKPEKYVIYEESQIKDAPDFVCETIDPAQNQFDLTEFRKLATQQYLENRSAKCVKIYFELERDLVVEKGGTAGASNWISGVFSVVQTLYNNENISTQIAQIYAWTTNDNYPTNGTSNALTAFRTRVNNGLSNGTITNNFDVGHLVSRGAPSNGGVAWVDALCSSYAYAYSWVGSGYNAFPTYSWTVNVIAHEMGHNLGSPHTHSCSWSGGALDNCYTTEGGCPKGPAPANGGTIMSYCHLGGGPGINFNNGFGTQPGNLIRNKVNGASCLADCGGGGGDPTCNDGIQNQGETGVDCGGPCPACPTCNDGIQNQGETGVDCGGPCDPCSSTSYCASKANNNNYEYIKNVAFSNINNTTGKDGGYGNYTSLTANINQGSSYPISITPGFTSSSYKEYFEVYIDFNGDNDFSDDGEKVFSANGNSTVSGNVNVPSWAVVGTTRMRVQMQWNNAINNPCATLNYGEVEDYSVSISGGGTPTCNDGIQNGNETGVDCGGSCPPCPTCNDGIQNQGETGVDCGGPCPACPTCDDGIQNQGETGVDCGGPCPACPPTSSCTDGIKNGDETGVDCGGSCPPCPTCNDGIQNQGETGVDCGGPCAPCTATCNDGIQNQGETGVDCGGPCPACPPPSYCASKGNNTNYEYIKRVVFGGIDNSSGSNGGYGNYTNLVANVEPGNSYSISLTPGYKGSSYTEHFAVYIDWNRDGDLIDPGEKVFSGSGKSTVSGSVTVPVGGALGSTRMRVQMQWNSAPGGPCNNMTYGEVEDYTVSIGGEGGSTPTCNDGIQNQGETGVDCGGPCPACPPTPTCNDGIKNGNETGVDCGGSCPPCPTCNDGIQNQGETGVDCGGPCPACPPTSSCNDGIKNGNETGVDCGGSCPPCATCNDGIQNQGETGVDCGGPCAPCVATCNDGIKNGNETGVDCGGSCPACPVNYCSSSGTKTTYEWINKVVFGSINNVSGNNGGYADYTSLTANVSQGGVYPITLEPKYKSTVYKEGWNVWIDFNGDGDFTDGGEKVYTGLVMGTVNTNITIPATAKTGVTRMRIQMQWNGAASSSCSTINWGEVEDYSVNIGGANSPAIAGNLSEIGFEIDIYPNPVSKILNIRFRNQPVGTIVATIYNVVGQAVKRETLNSDNLEVYDLESGYYLLEIKTDDGKIIKKFLKE